MEALIHGLFMKFWRNNRLLLNSFLLGFVLFSSSVWPNETFNFTPEERIWLSQNKELNVALTQNSYPYLFKNDRGEVDGIVHDFIREIAELTHLRVNYVRVESWKGANELLDSGKIDVLPISFHKIGNDDKYLHTNDYLPYQKQLITQYSSPIIHTTEQFKLITLAVVDGSDTQDLVNGFFPDMKTIVFETKAAALRAVSKGEAYGMISELVSAMNLASEFGIENLKPNGIVKDWFTSFASFTLHKDATVLHAVMNKALGQMSYESQNYIISKWLKDNPYRIKLDGVFDFGNPPYMYADSPTIGIEYSLLQELFNNMGFQIGDSHRAVHSRRTNILTNDSEIDFNSGIVSKLPGNHYYSDSLVDVEYIAVSLVSRELTLTRSNIEEGARVGAVIQDGDSPSRKAVDAFLEQTELKSAVDYPSLKSAFEALNNQSVDVLIVETRVLDWYLQHESDVNRNTINRHSSFTASFPIYVEFRKREHRDRFNASLNSVLANKPAIRQFVTKHIEMDFRPQLKRMHVIAQVLAMYLYKDDTKGIESIVEIFDLAQDLAAIEILGNKEGEKLYSVINSGGRLIEDQSFNTSSYTSVSKDSIYSSENGDVKVGVVTFHFDLKNMDSNYAYLPSLDLFQHLEENERIYIDKIYEENELTGQILNLTPEELEWISSNPNQRMAVDPNALPYEGFSSDGKYIGMIAEFIEIINAKTGLLVEPVHVKSWVEATQLINNNDVTMISAAVENRTFTGEYQPALAIISSPLAIASKIDTSGVLLPDLMGWRVGVLESASNTKVLLATYPDIDWVMIDNTSDGLDQVEKGELDAMLDTVHVLNYLISHHGYYDMRIVGRSNYVVSPTFHISSDEPILNSIIDKAIRSIDQQQKTSVISKWSAPKTIDNTNYQLIYLVTGFSMLFIIISLIWNRRLKTEVQRTKQAQAEAVILQEQLIGVLNASPIAAAIIQNDKVVYTNDTALDLFDIGSEVVSNVNVESIYSTNSTLREIYRELLEKKHVINKEVTLNTMNGKAFTALTSYYLIKNEGETATLFWAYDISELKELNEQLNQAMISADAANQAKSDFLANMSHEIRTPMNAILGMAYLALQEEQSPQAKNYVKKVHRSAEFLLSIINDILDFSKIEAGKLNIEKAPFQLSTVLEGLNDVSSVSAKDKPVKVLLVADQKIPNSLIGDSVRLFQVLLNLIGNAIKFTSNGEVSLNVRLVERSEEFAKLQFEVIDTGIGIGIEQQQDLFKAFSQADASTTRKYGGTGLGLNISQQLVSVMGGDITVESELGKGSCFSFELCFGVNESSLNDLKEELSPLEHQLRTSLSRPSLSLASVKDETVETNDAEQFIPINDLKRLAILIEAYDIESKSVVSELIERVPQASQKLSVLVQYLEDYDFEIALEVVQQWLVDR
ncbi:ATP-binding protein [Vibrio genomosp. F10]|uniref:ATP-binding protein n=1 Tax=Vibrio genomosp. F10 TaxID=723171 RepID=UPI000300B041|nr:transporter substrate-binding domain-containing protein [Vibrio genomosp. F10]OEE99379.1 hypothetical protein A1QK_01850 [Vibrio genomosp. F10 str. 9ZD137]